MLWLAAILFCLMPRLCESPESLDPMMALVTGMGIGGVTQLFAVLLTLSWQFFFRKKGQGENSK